MNAEKCEENTKTGNEENIPLKIRLEKIKEQCRELKYNILLLGKHMEYDIPIEKRSKNINAQLSLQNETQKTNVKIPIEKETRKIMIKKHIKKKRKRKPKKDFDQGLLNVIESMASLSTIYYRIAGYVFTLILHISNIFWMYSCHTGEIMKDPTVEFFVDNQFRYITTWTFFTHIFHAMAGLICDCLTLKNASRADYELPRQLRNFRDTAFGAIMWPSSLLVSSMFWGLYNYNRNLIMPEVLDKVLRLTQNHIIHTVIVPTVFWELYFQPRRAPRSHKSNALHLLVFVVLYHAVLFYTYVEKGMWIYPVFEELYGTIYFPIFLLFTLALFTFYYCIQWPLTKLLWGDFQSAAEQVYGKAK